MKFWTGIFDVFKLILGLLKRNDERVERERKEKEQAAEDGKKAVDNGDVDGLTDSLDELR